MLELQTSNRARKSLRTVHPKHAQQIGVRIQQLRSDPEPHDARPLKGKLSAYLRVDSGEYRIIYRVIGGVLEIVMVGKRNDSDVYRRMARH